MNLRTAAKTTGWSLVAMAAVAGVALGWALGEVQKAPGNTQMFWVMAVGLGITIVLDALVSFTLYKFFERDNSSIALWSALARVAYTAVLVLAATLLFDNGTAPDTVNFDRFTFVWNCGLVVFGLHLVLVGVAMRLHRRIPAILWILALVAGVSYFVISGLKVAAPGLASFTAPLETVLMLPMAAGELGLAVWLIVKGGKQ